MTIEIYQAGFDQARQLIAEGNWTNDKGDWHLINPDTEQQDAFIEENGIEAWGKWHLGYRPGEESDTKEAYAFPYGDYTNVDRAGLMAAEERSRQYGYEEINVAARRLLNQLDTAIEESGGIVPD